MSSLRQDLASKEWVVIAPERAKRPEDFSKGKEKKQLPAYVENCPFCPGCEAKTPAELLAFRPSDTKPNEIGWTLRVIPNRFAALSLDGDLERRYEGIFRYMKGVGIAEVIVETPEHHLTIGQMSDEKVEEIFHSYQLRYQELEKDLKLELIVIFRNHGTKAGTSLEHPHSQILAIPVIPSWLRSYVDGARTYNDNTGKCVYCTMLSEELMFEKRIIAQTDHFVAFAPFASKLPYEVTVMPLRHNDCFGNADEDELKDIARLMNKLMKKYYDVLDDPDYNYVIMSAPTDRGTRDFYHWHLKIYPRLTTPAGFELGSGLYINIAPPEDVAKVLKL